MEAITAEEVIPHRPPMRMIDTLVEWSDDAAAAVVVFDGNHMAVQDGRVAEAALVECMAQTVAALEGAKTAARGNPGETAAAQVGMLCGVSDLSVVRRPNAGERLDVEVHVRKRLGPMALVDGRILCDGLVAAAGSLKLSV